MMRNLLSTFSFKKLIKIVITVLVICAITFVLNRLFTPKYISENNDGRITAEYYREREKLDLIVFGSSTVYNAIDPDKLYDDMQIRAYLRANASQTLWQSYYLLKDSLIDQRPELIMLDVSFLKNGEEFVEEPSNRKCMEFMRPSIYKYQAIKASMYEEEKPETYFFPVFRYHSRWKELKSEDWKYLFYTPNVTRHGYIEEEGVAENQQIFEPDEQTQSALSMKLKDADNKVEADIFPEKAVLYLDKFTEECADKNIQLYLFKTPTFVANWYDAYDEWLKYYVNYKNAEFKRDGKNYSINYVNYNDFADDMGIEVGTDYIDDGEHLNYKGAEKFTSYLERALGEEYGL